LKAAFGVLNVAPSSTCFLTSILLSISGKNNKEDCAEAAVPELQALLSTRDQGPYHHAFVILCPHLYFILAKYVKLTLSSNFRGASTLRSVATRRAKEPLFSRLIINLLRASSICQNLPLETP